MNFHENFWGINLALFMVGGIATWISGFRLSTTVDQLSNILGMGKAFAGMVLLGFATSLPEIATTVTASTINNPELAASNLMGGLSMQLAVLAIADVLFLRSGALTFVTPSPALLVSGVLLILEIAVAIMAFSCGELSLFGHLGVWPILLLGLYLLAVYVMLHSEKKETWKAVNVPEELPSMDEEENENSNNRNKDNKIKLISIFLLLCTAVLISGTLVSLTADALSQQLDISSGFIGATMVAIATSLPELSTTASAMRSGLYIMAVSNIFGTNILEVALLFVADISYTEGSIIDSAGNLPVYSAALGIVLTAIFLWGMLERNDRRFYGIGLDSFLVLVTYCSAMLLLYTVQ